VKINIELELTPEEARELIGLPNISSLHEVFLKAAQGKMAQTASAVDVEPIMKTWAGLGGLAQETIGGIMTAALNGAIKSAPQNESDKPKKSK
jgi:Holliday junction resolvasome RuvABC ATP-dependent DNA helicase subunit